MTLKSINVSLLTYVIQSTFLHYREVDCKSLLRVEVRGKTEKSQGRHHGHNCDSDFLHLCKALQTQQSLEAFYYIEMGLSTGRMRGEIYMKCFVT